MFLGVMVIRGFQQKRSRGESELAVIVKSKRLCGYVLTVTDKSPKKLRFTPVNRLQNYGLDIVESLCKADLVRVRGREDAARIDERKSHRRGAYVGLKTMACLALIAKEQGCILPKQYEQISTRVAEAIRLLVAWGRSDRERYGG